MRWLVPLALDGGARGVEVRSACRTGVRFARGVVGQGGAEAALTLGVDSYAPAAAIREMPVPPMQCPSCGRFLKNDLVASLEDAPAPCPRCGELLHPDAFVPDGAGGRDEVAEREVAEAEHEVAEAEVEVAGHEDVEERSVRPPDLAPEAVRDAPRDVLVGWDVDADAAEIASWRRDRRPFPADTVVVLGAGAVGAVAGALVDGHRRESTVSGRGAVLGLVLGLLGGAGVRRIWRLTD